MTTESNTSAPEVRNNWSFEEIKALFDLPFMELVYQAQTVHRQAFDPNKVQLSSLLSIKTGGCPEDCKYCPQSVHHNTDLEPEKLMDVDSIMAQAQKAKEQGASRFCMGAAWRQPSNRQVAKVAEVVTEIKAMGLETCVTLGMLKAEQAATLKGAGLDYYNHNIDTSPEHYDNIISTRTFQERLDTLENVRGAGINVCCGGILGLGETRDDRINFIKTLATLEQHPQSVPINQLIAVKGTPMENQEKLDEIEFIRTIAVARITMPRSYVRLSAGRDAMPETMQALCFLAGANSIFYGEQLLTTPNPEQNADLALLGKLGMSPLEYEALDCATS